MLEMRWVSMGLLVLGCTGPPSDRSGGWGQSTEDENAPEPVTLVEVEAVGRGDVSDLLMTSAVIESERSADLLPNATGIVLDVLRDEGDEVRRGDVLAVIDNVSLDAGAERAVADLNRLEVQLTEMRDLYAQGAVSERELAP